LRYLDEASRQQIEFTIDVQMEPARVQVPEPVLVEALEALLNNAFKYTPAHGRIRLALGPDPDPQYVRLSVADSGVGIPEKDLQKVFEPFYRTRRATGSSRPGTGLGLAFVKATVEAAGGRVRAQASDLGGTEIVLQFVAGPAAEEKPQGDAKMTAPLKVVIVGGAVAGPKAAAKILRLQPDAEVTVVERNQFLAGVGCSLPYYIAGVVKNHHHLLSTPAGKVRDLVFFQNVKNVRVLNQTEALAIDPARKTVRLRDRVSSVETALAFDKLILTTGAVPVAPAIPGADLPNVVPMHGLISAEHIKQTLARGGAHDVVIVGGGILGVEVTESLVERGCRVTIVERKPQLMRILDWEMAALVQRYLLSKGVKIMTATEVQAFKGDGRVTSVLTDRGELPADLVIMAIGFQPEVRLAQSAGLTIGETGAIRVDAFMRTSDPNIYAAGDCVETTHVITGQPTYVPYGSVATKQGRVAAVNVCGGQERFPGVLHSAVCKVFDYCVARTGLTEQAAREHGYDVVTVLCPAPDREPFMPNAKIVMLKLVVDRRTRKLLGAQAVGPGMGEKRIDLAIVAITASMTVDQIGHLDLCYAPPYSPVMDNLITAANIARNKLDGHFPGVSPHEVHEMLEAKADFVFLDVRTPAEHEQVRLPGARLITLGNLRSRLDDLPRDQTIVTFCQTSLRAYEAALVLRSAGFERVRVLDGGIEMWPYERLQ
jgi:NADPH-dependent 2,4-dienoyl-CoA reductase/sulfur reductase-like enzyme/rhodanese-related sulfurtransferase